MKRLLVNDPELIKSVVDCLAAGGLIVYPTETSYGLGADATNSQAIEKLIQYKGNRLNKAVSVAVADKQMAGEYIEMNPTALNIFNTLLPGPVTVVAKGLGKMANQVQAQNQSLGVRWSSLPVVSEMAKALGKPITATSANTSGTKQIFSFEEWQKYVPSTRQKMIDIFVDAGKLEVKPPSTIVDTTLDNPEILRQGELVFGPGATHWVSNGVEDTISLGKRLIEQQMDMVVTQPLVIALEGVLGAGKTHLAKGVAEALGIAETVNSPTYTIMREYPYRHLKIAGVFYHIDTWRLFEGENISSLGIEDHIGPGTVIVIEWQQKAKEWMETLKKPVLIASVKLEVVSETSRNIVVEWEQKSDD